MALKIKGPVLRDTIQWMTGLGISINEAVLRADPPRWEVLVFAGILMGLPAVIGLLNLKSEPGGAQHLPPIADSPSSPQSPSS